MTSLRQKIIKYNQDHHSASNEEYKIAFHDYNWNSVRTYMNEVRNQNYKNDISIQNDISPTKNKVKRRVEVRKNKPNNKSNNKSVRGASKPSHDFILPKFEGDEIEFAKQAFIKGIEAGNFNLISGWVQFLDKTGKLQDYKTNREEELQETFKYMTPRELVMEAIGVQREVEESVKTLLKDTSQEQDS